MKPQPMTPDEARSFASYSVANAVRVSSSLTCGCQPYQDVFTYRRWQAQGFQVQKGEHAVRIPVVKERTETDDESGETRSVRILGSGAVFCRCQVKAMVPDNKKTAEVQDVWIDSAAYWPAV